MRGLMTAGLGLALFGLALPAMAGEVADEVAEELRNHLAEQYPEFEVDSIEQTPLDGVYEVVSGTQVLYISGDARYLLQGELLDLEQDRNLTAEVRQGLSHGAVAAVDDRDMVVYEPADGSARHEITVFTDVTCPYCRTLHEDLLDMIDEHGVRVRYLMFPRAGVNSDAAETLANIWCADDPQIAMTEAKRGESVPEREADCEPPVASQYELGQRIGVSGTPYVLLDRDGPVFAGYRSKEQLLGMLRE